jgi:hypothetical protein
MFALGGGRACTRLITLYVEEAGAELQGAAP